MTDRANALPEIKPKLSQTARRLLAGVQFASDVETVLSDDYLVKGWMHRGSVSVVYGEANVGKSFFAIDLAHHIQQGKVWSGYRVFPGPVLYIAAEGGSLFINRLVAAAAGFAFLQVPVRLGGRSCDAPALVQVVRHLAQIHGPFAFIVFDTLSRVMAGDENSAPDVGALIRGVDLLRRQTGAHVMLVHHSGKDVAKGARGHSSLRAAVDTEIELTVSKETGERMARVTKQRDMSTGAECLFRLEQVDLGRDRDGDAVTSCIVKHTGAPDRNS